MKNSGCEVPPWMLTYRSTDPSMRRKKRKDGKEDNPRREPIDTMRAMNDAAKAAKAAAARNNKKSKRGPATREGAPTRGTEGGGAPPGNRGKD
jgi:hypothetical protein